MSELDHMTDENVESLKQKNMDLQETAELYNCMVQIIVDKIDIQLDMDEIKQEARKLMKSNDECHTYHDDNQPPSFITISED